MTTTPLYVYGVVPAAGRDTVSVAGVEGEPVYAVAHEGLAALASPVYGDALRVAREVRAHLRVLQDVAEETTVLPVRFGTVLDGEAEVRERLLEPNAERLEALITRLSGCVQMSVKGEYDEPALVAELVAASPPLAKLAALVRNLPAPAGYYDRIRLGQAIADAVGARREADTARAQDLLADAAVEIRIEDPTSAFQAFNLSCLVERKRQAAFTHAVQRLGEEHGELVAIRYVGPLPAYSFTDSELEPA